MDFLLWQSIMAVVFLIRLVFARTLFKKLEESVRAFTDEGGSCRNKDFRGFNGFRTSGLCVRAAVLYQLSYEDPYIGMKHRMK